MVCVKYPKGYIYIIYNENDMIDFGVEWIVGMSREFERD